MSELPPYDILTDEKAEKEGYNMGAIADAKEAIKSGKVFFIAVVFNSKNELIVVDGAHRVAAAKILGETSLLGFITKDSRITGDEL